MKKSKVSKEELLHIANLADLNLKEDEIDDYFKNLDEILNYAEVIQNAPIKDLKETIGANDNCNVFRKDEVKMFENHEGLLANAPEIEREMFKIPKVIN